MRWRLALSCRWLASPAPLSLAERARVVREWISVGASSPTREQSLHHFSRSLMRSSIAPSELGLGRSINMVPSQGRVVGDWARRWVWSASIILYGSAVWCISNTRSRYCSLRERMWFVRINSRSCATLSQSAPVRYGGMWRHGRRRRGQPA